MSNTKYGFSVSAEVLSADINRLTNQLWKLIPMRENNENWKEHLQKVIIEISGMHEVFNHESKLLVLLCKLEGIRTWDTEFHEYRTTVFESISLLREMRL